MSMDVPGHPYTAIMDIAGIETRLVQKRVLKPAPVPPAPYYSSWWSVWLASKFDDNC